MKNLSTRFYLLILLVSVPLTASAQLSAPAKDDVFAIVIGNNAVPADGDYGLKQLRYADDDAVRYYNFFLSMTTAENVRLLTSLDARTQKKYQGTASAAVEPTVSNLLAAVRSIKSKIERSKKTGRETAVFIVFSGHGAMNELSVPFLTMTDGPLTGELLYNEILPLLKTNYQHLIVDACYAKGVVAPRGMFEKEYNSAHTAVSDRDLKQLESAAVQRRYSGLGLIIASSEYEESHEWSKIESGVFTHEVLSGLSGPADINLDGRIEYSELSAFIAAANRGVEDVRGRANVIAEAPLRNSNVPIIDYTKQSNRSFLYGDASKLSHFHIELENGERYLDANLTDMHAGYVALPRRKSAFLRTDTQEAFLDGNSANNLKFGALRFVPRTVASRGGIESSFRKGLFQFPFGVPYYLGHVDSIDINAVDMNAEKISFEPNPRASTDNSSQKSRELQVASITFFALAGASLAAATTLGVLSLNAKSDYQRTTVERDSREYSDTYRRLGTAFWATAALVPVFVVLGAVFQIKSHRKLPAIAFDTDFENALRLRYTIYF